MAEVNTYAMSIEHDHEKLRNSPGGAVAQANGLFMCAFAGGTLVGPSLGGYLKERHGWGVMTLFQGMLSAAMAVIMVLALLLPREIEMGGIVGEEDENEDEEAS